MTAHRPAKTKAVATPSRMVHDLAYRAAVLRATAGHTSGSEAPTPDVEAQLDEGEPLNLTLPGGTDAHPHSNHPR